MRGTVAEDDTASTGRQSGKIRTIAISMSFAKTVSQREPD
jgi:hypothetical protein